MSRHRILPVRQGSWWRNSLKGVQYYTAKFIFGKALSDFSVIGEYETDCLNSNHLKKELLLKDDQL